MEVKLLATKALLNALNFMNPLLAKEEIRIYILDLLVACSLTNYEEI